MTSRRSIALAAIALAVSALVAPDTAAAFRGGMGGSAFRGVPPMAHSFGPRSFASQPIGGRAPGFHGNRAGHRFHHRHFRNSGFGYYGVVGSPLAVYAPPFYSPGYGDSGYDGPAYYPDPVAYPPVSRSVSLAPPPVPSAPPMPTVVEFSTGRYELRGDGLTAPYAWVWIPNPPTAPPPSSVPAPPASGQRSRLYRWTDEQGVLHLTDQPDAVPEQYRRPPKQPS